MNGVTVKVYGTVGSEVGNYQARAGQPVEITVTRGRNSQSINLSMAEATQLADALQAAREGKAA